MKRRSSMVAGSSDIDIGVIDKITSTPHSLAVMAKPASLYNGTRHGKHKHFTKANFVGLSADRSGGGSDDPWARVENINNRSNVYSGDTDALNGI